jgi:trans-aconitate methyltransferase
MARANASFGSWLVDEISRLDLADVSRVVELGPGPGIALAHVLTTFPEARVWGIDLSPEMLAQSRKRNVDAAHTGRLTLLQGDVASLSGLAPVDLVYAAHVLYFWHLPGQELARIRAALRPGGSLVLGYQLRQNMPKLAQLSFPEEGNILYDSDEQVAGLLKAASFSEIRFLVKGPADAPEGRLAISRAG